MESIHRADKKTAHRTTYQDMRKIGSGGKAPSRGMAYRATVIGIT